MELTNKLPGIHSNTIVAMHWLDGSEAERTILSVLSNDHQNQWLEETIPNYDVMLASLVKDAYKQVLNIAFSEIGKKVGVTNLYGELTGYIDQATNIMTITSNVAVKTMETGNLVLDILSNEDLIAFMGSLGDLTSNPNIATNAGYLEFQKMIDVLMAALQGDIGSMMNSVLPTNSSTDFLTVDPMQQIEDLKEMPVSIVQNFYDRGTGFLTAAVKDEIHKQVSSLVGQLLDLDFIKNFKLSVTVPPGFVGMGIMAATSYLASDYLKNTDLKSEGGKLLLSKIFGLVGGQSGDGPVMGASFEDMAGHSGTIMSLMANDHPRVVMTKLNGKTFNQYETTSGNGVEALMNVAQGNTVNISKVSVKDFVNSAEGMVMDTVPGMVHLSASLNYGNYVPLTLTPEGKFTLRGFKMIEGANHVSIATATLYTNREGQETVLGSGINGFDIMLDMMPPQAFAEWPAWGEVLNLQKASQNTISLGLYFGQNETNSPADGTQISWKRLPIPWRQTNSGNSGVYEWHNITSSELHFAKGSVNGTWDINFHIPSEVHNHSGHYAVRIVSLDAAGNKSESVFGFYNDLDAPVLFAYPEPPIVNGSGYLRDPFQVSDGLLPRLTFLKVDFGNQHLLTKGATIDGWNTLSTQINISGSGKGDLTVRASDLAGNVMTTNLSFYYDTEVPQLTADFNEWPKLFTLNNSLYDFPYSISDAPGVPQNEAYLRLQFIRQGDAKVYYGGDYTFEDDFGTSKIYLWSFSDPFRKMQDGLYTFKVWTADKAGNSKEVTNYEVRVDRTAPVVYESYCMPQVMAMHGGKTELRFKLSEDDDVAVNRGSVHVSLRVIEKNSGNEVFHLDSIGNRTDGSENVVSWDGTDVQGHSLPRGIYDMIVRAEDIHGNITLRYAETVKGGVRPEITSPKAFDISANTNVLAPVDVAGKIGVFGIAKDPVFDNTLSFEDYAVYLYGGLVSKPSNLCNVEQVGWTNLGLEVPTLNRPVGGELNVSLRPVENDAVLAYLDTTVLSNGDYTLLLIASEKDGMGLVASADTTASVTEISGTHLADVSYIHVCNATNGNSNFTIDPAFADAEHAIMPADIRVPIVTNHLPSLLEIDPDKPVASNSFVMVPYHLDMQNVFSANVLFEVLNKAGESVYQKKKWGVSGFDRVKRSPGVRHGFNVWQDEDGWNIEIRSTNAQETKFSGLVKVQGELQSVSGHFDVLKDGGIIYRTPRRFDFSVHMTPQDEVIYTQTNGTNNEIVTNSYRRISFKVNADRVRFELYENDQPQADIIHVGGGNPVLKPIFDNLTQNPNVSTEGLDFLTNAVSFFLTNARPSPPFKWKGQNTYGSTVEDGSYRLQLTADGAEGRGYDRVVSDPIWVSSPLNIVNAHVEPTNFFDPMQKGCGKITLAFRVNKKAIVNVDVVDITNGVVNHLITGQPLLGFAENILSYNGTLENASSRWLDNGNYAFRIHAEAQQQSTNISVPFEIKTENEDPLLLADLKCRGNHQQ